LEARWNKALARMAEVEGKIAARDATNLAPVADPRSLATLAADLKTIWTDRSTDARLKKRVVRTIIHEVVADVDAEAAEIVLVIHWVGGIHGEIRLPRRRRGQRSSTSSDVIAAVRHLVLIANDDLIAGILNRNGLVTGYGNRRTRERVTSPRSHHRIAVYKPTDDGNEPWLNLSKAAGLLRVSPRTLRLAPLGFLAAPFSRHHQHAPPLNAHNKIQNTPRDRIPISKACSLQSHRQMGVVMRGRNGCAERRARFGLKRGRGPFESPQGNGVTGAFVGTSKRDYVPICPRPDA
jgi:hypothetical protein